MAAKIKYLNNRELLEEIHKSKVTYCELVHPDYQDKRYLAYDIIVSHLDEITAEIIEQARSNHADRKHKRKCEELIDMGFEKKEITITPTPEKVKDEDIVFRVMTYEHIPPNPDKPDAPNEKDRHLKCCFPPFKHYIVVNGKPVEVVRSHSNNGEFDNTHGKLTDRLALMFMKLVDRYGSRGNWRGYTYNEDMKSQALLQLSQVGLQFDESRSANPNPFAYYTATINNSFTRILNIEKKNQNIRDDLLEAYGVSPSYTRQIEHEHKVRAEEFEKRYREEV